jgi:hypothetical protein
MVSASSRPPTPPRDTRRHRPRPRSPTPSMAPEGQRPSERLGHPDPRQKISPTHARGEAEKGSPHSQQGGLEKDDGTPPPRRGPQPSEEYLPRPRLRLEPRSARATEAETQDQQEGRHDPQSRVDPNGGSKQRLASFRRRRTRQVARRFRDGLDGFTSGHRRRARRQEDRRAVHPVVTE